MTGDFFTSTDYRLNSGFGLSEDTIRYISSTKKEDNFLLEFRLKALRCFFKASVPQWCHQELNNIDFQNLQYYLAVDQAVKKDWESVPTEIKTTFERLGVPEKERKERVERMISLMGLEKFRKSYARELSVSTEQRMVIARAFASSPDLLLMDEPYGQMDIKMRFYLEDEVIRLWKEMGTTVIFITHNIEEAVYLAEKILILSNKPATIKEQITVDLQRPRDVTNPKFIEIRKYVTDKIKCG